MKHKDNVRDKWFSFICLAVVGCAFIAIPASAITYIGDIGTATIKDNTVANLIVTTTSAVSAGDDIVIAYATDPSQDLNIAISDAAGNKYQQAAMGISVGNLRTYIFAAYNVNALSSGSNINITQTVYSSTKVAARAAVVSVFSGLAPVGALEQSCVGSGTNSASPSSGAATTIQADQLLIGAVGTEGPQGDNAGTWSNSFIAGPRAGTTAGTGDTEITISMGWRIVTSAGSYTAAKTGITSRDWAAAIATFKTTDAGISFIGDVGKNWSKTAGTSLAITTSAAVAAGDDIMLTFAMDGNSGSVSVSDGTNTYNNVADAQFPTPSNTNVRTIIFAAYNVSALSSGSTINITHPSITARSAVVSVFRGLANSSAFDKKKEATGTSKAVSSGATDNTSQANELLIGAVGLEGPNVDAPSVWQNSFTYGPRLGTSFGASSGDATDITAQMGWRIVGTSAAYTAQIIDQNTQRDWAAAIATFKYEPPIAVELASFNVRRSDDGAMAIEWTTASEAKTAGFFVQRSNDKDDGYRRIHDQIIPAKGNGSAGAVYNFVDTSSPAQSYYYRLEEVSLDGQSTLHQPVAVSLTSAVESEANMPFTFALSQNYPNPFNPVTKIDYTLPQSEQVTLSIYNLNGRLVKQLVNDRQKEGCYSVTWDGTDEQGLRVVSGTYLYRLSAGEEIAVHKMVLLK